MGFQVDRGDCFVTPVTSIYMSIIYLKTNKLLLLFTPKQISQDQVMMSHSPLRMFKRYHEKCVLVSGQGPLLDIAQEYLKNTSNFLFQYLFSSSSGDPAKQVKTKYFDTPNPVMGNGGSCCDVALMF